MIKYSLLFSATLWFICISCTSLRTEAPGQWHNAHWIGYEILPDSMKVVPGVHGFGNGLDNKCLKAAVIPLFRREFNINGKVEEAIIKICGLGQYELYLNGNKVGDRFLSPGWSYYQKRCLYNTYDITERLKEGKNALGVITGTGFFYISRERYRKLVQAYGYPRLIFDLTIRYSDGSVDHVVSGKKCQMSPSAITFSSIYGGEDYDARLEQPGWDIPGFDDYGWREAVELTDTMGELVAEDDHPVRIMQEFDTQKITVSKTGQKIYDFGQNASGIIALKVKGNTGSRVRIIPGELLDDAGNISQVSSGGPYEFNYTLKGEGEEEWQPRFSYYGFRYAAVEVIEDENEVVQDTKVLDLRMLHTRNSAPATGSFRCSDTLFNQIFELINWGIKSNMASVATDCPHREKLGWLEQTYLIGPSMHYNFDIHSFYTKIIHDMADSQLENGLVPDIAPEYVPFNDGFRDSPEWGSASVIIPWQVYTWYGDRKTLEEAYPMMKKYLTYLQGKANHYILDYGLGDWYDLGPKPPGEAQLTPKGLTATSVFFYDMKIMEKTARLLGFDEDFEKYSRLAEDIRTAFLDKYFNPENGRCATGSQTSYAMPLYVGLIPNDIRELVFTNLVDSIRVHNYALTSGDIGYHFLVRVLSEGGRSDVLFRMNNRTDRPGYGYQLKKGATALTESWEALPTSSNNHMMLGHLMEWFYNGLGGIYQEKNSIAYENIIIAPKPVGTVTWVKCSFNSPKGLISTDWKIEDENFIMEFTVPEGSNATIVLPEDYGKSVRLTDLETNETRAVQTKDGKFMVLSGNYRVSGI